MNYFKQKNMFTQDNQYIRVSQPVGHGPLGERHNSTPAHQNEKKNKIKKK